jgi:hypothetical protein
LTVRVGDGVRLDVGVRLGRSVRVGTAAVWVAELGGAVAAGCVADGSGVSLGRGVGETLLSGVGVSTETPGVFVLTPGGLEVRLATDPPPPAPPLSPPPKPPAISAPPAKAKTSMPAAATTNRRIRFRFASASSPSAVVP